MESFDYAELNASMDELTSAFSNGGPGFQFFRLEQREVGERMLAAAGVMGRIDKSGRWKVEDMQPPIRAHAIARYTGPGPREIDDLDDGA